MGCGPRRLLLLFGWMGAAGIVASADDRVDYQKSIRAILSDNCYHCHGPDETAREGGLRLDTQDGAVAQRESGAAIVPGKPAESLIYQRLTSTDPDIVMPPPNSGRKMTPAQVELIRRWIDEGAEWKEHWAFVPPVQAVLPEVANKNRQENPIDSFILHRLETEHLPPSPTADRRTLVRRMSLDVRGLPPSIDEVEQVLQDRSADAMDRWVDRLLASPAYGEHLAAGWLDAARYADTNGYQNDGTRTQWPWRDWVIRSINGNLPFDEFVRLQMAGDLKENASREEQLATGFHRNHMLNGEGGRIAEESRVEYCIDRVDTTATVFLGLTLGCARCHDHKYDPFTTSDYYRLMGFFNSIEEVGGVDRGGNAAPTIKIPTPEQELKHAELARRLAELEGELSRPVDTSPSAQHAWEERILQETASQGPKDVETLWQPVVPEFVHSEGGSQTVRLDDYSVLVSGNNPETDVYRVLVPAMPFRALLLEALPDPSMTQGGLARSDSGNFVLTEVEIYLRRADGGEPIRLAIERAEADFEQPGYSIVQSIDGNDATGWAVLSNDMKQTRRALWRLSRAVDAEPGAKIEIVLKSQSKHLHHIVGRFRLSLNRWEKAQLPAENSTPDYVLTGIQSSAGARPDVVARALREYFEKDVSKRAGLTAQRDQVRKEIEGLENGMLESMVLKDLPSPRKTYVLIRGQYDKPDLTKELQPGIPAALAKEAIERANRMTLADWMVSPQQPLTPRVTVNRYWQHFFGHGIVRTVEDFGSQGELPSHPELLDWLSVELRTMGWNVKSLHRLILTSRTYQQSSAFTAEVLERDPSNRLLSRGPRHRLSAQVLRDQALVISGLLVDTMGGPGVNPYQPANVWTDFSLGKIQYEQGKGSELYRKSIYTFWRRSVGPTMIFDASTRQVCEVRQRLTNTPLQALTLLNDTTYVEAARVLAEHVLRHGGTTPAERLAYAFLRVTGRPINEQEETVLRRRLERSDERFHSHPEEAAALLKVGESPAPSDLPPAELASYAVVMNVLLNLDEVVTKE